MKRLRSAWPILAVWFAGDIAVALSGDIGGAVRFGIAGVLLAVIIASGAL